MLLNMTSGTDVCTTSIQLLYMGFALIANIPHEMDDDDEDENEEAVDENFCAFIFVKTFLA